MSEPPSIQYQLLTLCGQLGVGEHWTKFSRLVDAAMDLQRRFDEIEMKKLKEENERLIGEIKEMKDESRREGWEADTNS